MATKEPLEPCWLAPVLNKTPPPLPDPRMTSPPSLAALAPVEIDTEPPAPAALAPASKEIFPLSALAALPDFMVKLPLDCCPGPLEI